MKNAGDALVKGRRKWIILMASQIDEKSREYVADNAASYDSLDIVEAVFALTENLKSHVRRQGWNPLDYQVDIGAIVRNVLIMHRERY